MSVREREENKNKSVISSGLGLAAAAIGVGVGAALYYFYNRRPEERPHAEHSSSDDERQKTLERAGLNRQVAERFRQRSWSLEECSVCCEVMLTNQDLEMLPCGHQFHASCIRPWLEEKTTCPNCRTTA